jgi:dephospho-CoA kinase
MLIGVCGKAGAGKDTIADYWVKKHGFKKIALADPIKRIVQDVFVLDDHTVYDRVAREQPIEKWNGWSVRRLLQIIGTELFRNNIDEGIWVKSLLYRVQSDPEHNYIVPDVRFPNELQYLSENSDHFISIKVVRRGCDGNVGEQGHESEAYDLETKYILDNNSTFDNLYKQIEEIARKEGIV